MMAALLLTSALTTVAQTESIRIDLCQKDINRCVFHAVEFFNEHHPDPNMPEQFDQEDGLFKFEKKQTY